MDRRLIRQGGGGYTVYLPKTWIDENKLDKGDEITITMSGKELILSPKTSQKKSETEIKLFNNFETTIKALIENAYRGGYDRINIHYNNEDEFKTIQKILKTRLIGFEVVKKESSRCVLENITEPSFDQFDNILRKLFMSLEEEFEITLSRLKKNNDKVLEDHQEVHDRMHKYDNFCRRVLIRQRLINKNSEMFLLFISKLLNSFGDIYYINLYLDKHPKTKISKGTIDLMEKAFSNYKLVVEAYYKKDITLLSIVHQSHRELVFVKTKDMLEKGLKEERIIIFHIGSFIRQLHLSTSPLIGMIV